MITNYCDNDCVHQVGFLLTTPCLDERTTADERGRNRAGTQNKVHVRLDKSSQVWYVDVGLKQADPAGLRSGGHSCQSKRRPSRRVIWEVVVGGSVAAAVTSAAIKTPGVYHVDS